MNDKKNWHMRIDEAEAAGGFTEEDNTKASGWVDCCCGQQDPRIPRNRNGAPNDEELLRHSIAFCSHVADNNFKSARATMLKIEQRSAEILAEMGL